MQAWVPLLVACSGLPAIALAAWLARSPLPLRREAWSRLARDLDPALLERITGSTTDDLGTRIDVRLVDGANLLGLVGEDARGPQGIAKIVPALLEFGGEAAVDGHGGPCEEAARIGGAQM